MKFGSSNSFKNKYLYFIIFLLLSYTFYLTFYIYNNNKYNQPLQTQHNQEKLYVPINIKTNSPPVMTAYNQLGILSCKSSNNKKDIILPLFGRPLYYNRNTWQYYAMSDQNNSIKLPISKRSNNKKRQYGSDDYGCDELYDNDTVFVEGYNELFNVRIYNDNIKPGYIPYIY
jgi:hypothetical protein